MQAFLQADFSLKSYEVVEHVLALMLSLWMENEGPLLDCCKCLISSDSKRLQDYGLICLVALLQAG